MRKKIGELLVEAGVTTPDEVNAALGAQRAGGSRDRLGQVLLAMKRGVTPSHIARALGVQYELPYVELPQIPSSVSAMVPMEFQTEHKIIPFQLEREGKVERLHLAISDPSKLDLVDELRFQLGKPIRVFVAAADDIEEFLSALGGDVAELDAFEADDSPEDAVTDPGVAQGYLAGDPPIALGNEFFEDDAQAPPAAPAGGAGTAALPPEWDAFDAALPPGAPEDRSAPPMMNAPASSPPGRTNGASPPQPAPTPAAPEVEPILTPAQGPGSAMVSSADLDDLLGGSPLGAMGEAPSADGHQRAAVHHFEARPRMTPAHGIPVIAGASMAAPPPSNIPGATTAAPPPSNLTVLPLTAAAAAPPASLEPEKPSMDFSEDDLKILENLERMALGDEPTMDSARVKPAQMVASLIRLLMKKGVIGETEFLEELGRK